MRQCPVFNRPNPLNQTVHEGCGHSEQYYSVKSLQRAQQPAIIGQKDLGMAVGCDGAHRIQHSCVAIRRCFEKQIGRRPYAGLDGVQESRPDGRESYDECKSTGETRTVFDRSQGLNHFHIEQTQAYDMNDHGQYD